MYVIAMVVELLAVHVQMLLFPGIQMEESVVLAERVLPLPAIIQTTQEQVEHVSVLQTEVTTTTMALVEPVQHVQIVITIQMVM
jgi:hypothetical protein